MGYFGFHSDSGYWFLAGNCLFWFGYSYGWPTFVICSLIILLGHRINRHSPFIYTLLGFSSAMVLGYLDDDWSFQPQWSDSKHRINAQIDNLPEVDPVQVRLVVSSINDQQVNDVAMLLVCYQDCPEFKLGQHWRLLVKLKPPTGLYNPGIFDYERWLFSQSIKARGYLVTSPDNQLIKTAEVWQRFRQTTLSRIRKSGLDQWSSATLAALILGYRSDLSQVQQDYLTSSGVGHLIAISGLHVSLAAIPGAYLGSLLWLLFRFGRTPRVIFKWLGAIASAGSFALMSGLDPPAQRAIIMLSLFALGALARSQSSFNQRLSQAIIIVLLVDPRATLSLSFWLSYVVTAFIAYRLTLQNTESYVLGLVRFQWHLSLVLSGLQLALFGQLSLASLLHNLWAIPWMSLVMLPLGLLWLVLELLSSFDAANYLLTNIGLFLQFSMQVFWGLLIAFDAQNWVINYPLSLLAGITVGLLLLLSVLPLGYRQRSLVLLLGALIMVPDSTKAPFSLYLFDVGQGLSLALRSHDDWLIYDTGFGSSDFSVAGRQLVPWFRTRLQDQINTLVVSHGDADHSGGIHDLTSALLVEQLVLNPNMPQQQGSRPCWAGQSWWLGEAKIKVLWPMPIFPMSKANDSSCVLLVTIYGQNILLTGDIERSAEKAIRQNYPDLKVDILLVPHHGSNTSSSRRLLDGLQPSVAINSSGYLNRFNFPAPEVRARYLERGIRFYDTAQSGALFLDIFPDGKFKVSPTRQQNPALWRRN